MSGCKSPRTTASKGEVQNGGGSACDATSHHRQTSNERFSRSHRPSGSTSPSRRFLAFLSSVYETRSGEVATEDAPRQQPNAAAGLGLRLRRRTTLI